MAHRRFVSFIRYFLLLLAIGSAAYAIIHFSDRAGTVYERPVAPVVIARPQRTDLAIGITSWGYVESDHTVAIVPLVGGVVTEYPIEVGVQIDEGDVIANIDPAPYRQQMLQAQAAKIVAETTFARIERLHRSKSVPDQIYEEALAQRDATLAQWEGAKLRLSQTEVTSPLRGTVLQTLSSTGNIASPDRPVALVADLTRLVVKVDIPASRYGIISANRANLNANVLHLDGHAVMAKVDTIAPHVDPMSNTFEITCEIDGSVDDLVPGMLVQVRIDHTLLEDVYTLGQADRRADGSFMLYDGNKSIAVAKDIEPIAENDESIAIDQSYSDTWFIVDGHQSILDGQTVVVVGER
jgi:RND family efflux transporter MFP subunit